MSNRRSGLKPVVLVNAYIKRSKELDDRLNDIAQEIEAHTEQVNKRDQFNTRLVEIVEELEDYQAQLDGLREKFARASFENDRGALSRIEDKRTSIVEAMDGLRQEHAQVEQQLNSVVIDGAAIAELSAELDAGIRPPDFREFLKVLEQDCKARASAQDKRLKELRGKVPAHFKDQQTYDAARKSLDSSYRTSEESKRAAEHIQAARDEERRKFLEHTPKPSDEIRKQKDRQLALANSTPVREVQQW